MESKIPAVEVKLGFKWQGLLIAVIVGLGIWLIPTPEGLSAKAWGMLALLCGYYRKSNAYGCCNLGGIGD